MKDRRLLAIVLLVAIAGAGCVPGDEEGQFRLEIGTAANTTHQATEADREAILGTVQALFDALAARDGATLRDLMDPDVLMHSVERAADGTRSQSTSTLDDLVARVEGSEEVLTERMFDPEVRVSGDLAMVWTPYDFYAGTQLSHCGADAVLLTREADDGWKIIALSWTRMQPPECELHPDGPPM